MPALEAERRRSATAASFTLATSESNTSTAGGLSLSQLPATVTEALQASNRKDAAADAQAGIAIASFSALAARLPAFEGALSTSAAALARALYRVGKPQDKRRYDVC